MLFYQIIKDTSSLFDAVNCVMVVVTFAIAISQYFHSQYRDDIQDKKKSLSGSLPSPDKDECLKNHKMYSDLHEKVINYQLYKTRFDLYFLVPLLAIVPIFTLVALFTDKENNEWVAIVFIGLFIWVCLAQLFMMLGILYLRYRVNQFFDYSKSLEDMYKIIEGIRVQTN